MKVKKRNNICPECEEGFLHSVFKSEIINEIERGDTYIECDSCEYSIKVTNKRNKIRYIVEE